MSEPIAIVGQGCVLPGALTPEALWSLVRGKRSALRRPSPGAWGIASHVDEAQLAAAVATKVGGYVRDDFDAQFDPHGFALDAASLAGLDPVFLWTLHAAREAMRSAGFDDSDVHPRAGLVLGNLSYPTPKLVELAIELWSGAPRGVDARNRFMSGLPALLAARALGFGGAAYALDAACASSLYAIKLACDRLQDGRADLMLAGGVNHADSLFLHAGFTAFKALSPTGQSRPFHRDADGLVPSEGAALVVLMRVSDALAQGKPVLGLIRGIGLSNDGRSRGLMVPDEAGQVRALRAAYRHAGLAPRDVSLVECHATGTMLGDNTELRSMRSVFEGSTDLPIGSLKSNLGHLITASGGAAVLKVLAAFKHEVRPATLHAEVPCAELGDRAFRLLHEEEPWTCAGIRRAAISNFGFGGNNAHLVLEEFRPRPRALPRTSTPVSHERQVAVVAQVVRSGAAGAATDLVAHWFDSGVRPSAGVAIDSFELDATNLRTPPADLQVALPQQLLLLAALQDLSDVVGHLPRERTGVLVGMQCDAEVARHAVRYRGSRAWIEKLPPSLSSEPLSASAAVGAMPNIVANRINQQLGFEGPSFTVSAEECSGVIALELAVRALRAGEIDAAVVGAVDMTCEIVQQTASRELLPVAQHEPGDAAVMLVLKRHADAMHAGDPVLALVDPGEAVGSFVLAAESSHGAPRHIGHAHAASGLLQIAMAVAACAQRTLPSPHGPMPWLPRAEQRSAEVQVSSLGGGRSSTVVCSVPGSRAAPVFLAERPHFGVAAADDVDGLLSALERRELAPKVAPRGSLRLGIVADSAAHYEARIERAIRRLRTWGKDECEGALEDGVFMSTRPLHGELAFVYTGAAGAYPQMGRDLALAFPDLVDHFAARAHSLFDAAGWVYAADPSRSQDSTPLEKLWGSSFLCQLHTELTRRTLGLRPTAAIGYCSGETNSMFALDAWCDLDGFRRSVEASHVYDSELCGELRCLRRAWQLDSSQRAEWAIWRVRAPIAEVRAALETEPRVRLTIINTREDMFFAGEPAACARVAARLGRRATRAPGYDFIMHCPEAREFESRWRALHTRPTAAVPGVRFYTHATCASYVADTGSVADALTGQAMNTVDFPALIERAWADGVRVFVEHGPHAGCTKWIGQILGEREHLAISLDSYGRSSLLHAVEAAAQLFVAGVEIDLTLLHGRLHAQPLRPSAGPSLAHQRTLRVPGHPSALPAAPREAEPPPLRAEEPLPPLWWQSVVRPDPAAHRNQSDQTAFGAAPGRAPSTRALAQLAAHHEQLSTLHRAFITHQAQTQTRFVNLVFAQQTAAPGTFGGPTSRGGTTGCEAAALPALAVVTPAAPVRAPVTLPMAKHATTESANRVPLTNATLVARKPPSPRSQPIRRPPSGPSFGRAELEIHASGRISEIFGPSFAQQDQHARQVRMPEPPLLLADRVLGIDGEPGTLGLGTIWTETDVRADAWYLYEGRMPAGLMVESGQADLMLISWLGADFVNRGERVYRLLGCELKSFGELPKVGETLHYQITVDGHAEQDGVRLFFFHYDCWINDELRFSVRNGQAGFFTDQELARSAGVLWSAETAVPVARDEAQLEPARALCERTRFDHDDIRALTEGRLVDCLGPAFARAQTHSRTPTLPAGRMRMFDDVSHFDPRGGPWGRGYLRARLALKPDHWFFRGHFKNDPCMPGTLMFEGGLQAMQIMMIALGHTLDHDGSRFEPAQDHNYVLRCRGQATPASSEVVYEIFVEEILGGPAPTLYADILGSVDGHKAFHCTRMALRLVPAWPLDPGRLALEAAVDERPVAVVDGFRFDYASLMACAWGKPSSAFGPMYARFDGPRRVARLPAPPYHFLSRVRDVRGPIGGMQVGSRAEIEYDVPADAWYFAENNAPSMPFAVLLETALQPCGWLASYVGGALQSEDNLYFRNLDGKGMLHAELPPDVGTVTIETTLKSVSRADRISIFGFDVQMRAGERLLYSLETVFGFFPRETLADQVGLPTSAEQRACLREPSITQIDLAREPSPYYGNTLRLPSERLRVIDRITGLWPQGGKLALGRLRAETAIHADQWFFKAHFYQDPVQPGSIGLQALLQALEALAISLDLDARSAGRFETQASGVPMTWKYRGQVVPENRLVEVDVEITRIETGDRHTTVVGAGSLWVDGKRIYEAQGLAVRLV
ncbi:MAG: beta-ketoacyl synthase N-terminal-like domain-containing protein [Myxococcales bacterium]